MGKPAQKLDLYKARKEEYVTPRKPALVTIKPARYLSIEGKGEPGGDAFTNKVGALYAVAFTVKMKRKFAGRDYGVSKLEGLWWGARRGSDFLLETPGNWSWKLLIRTPDFITEKEVREAIDQLLGKGKGPEVREVKLEEIEEGMCVQMLHVGPYSSERKTIALMEHFAKENGLELHGVHHEVYLSDPRRVAEAKLRTILRHPVKVVV